MGHPYRIVVIALAVTGVLCIIAGCASTPSSRFYVLSPLSDAERSHEAVQGPRGTVVGLGPVVFPEYLDRPHIVTRVGGSELTVAEFDYWAEPLDKSVPRVLAENLSTLLRRDDIIVLPWSIAANAKYRVMVAITRLDGAVGGDVVLTAAWGVRQERDKVPVVARKMTLSAPTDAPGYQGLVSAHNRVLADLSREIANALRTTHTTAPVVSEQK